MKAKAVFFTLLSCVLLLQSVWNVAAAWCVHENTQTVTVERTHFGHHVVTERHNSLHTQLEQVVASEKHDHSDHLPSLNPIMLSQLQHDLARTPYKSIVTVQKTDWKNLYQSPDLAFNSPPPILAPL
ncbi:cation efflux protein, CzcI-like [Acinetobacter rathckeae]|uniref:cation efflux protein, CzcI-like n=1 Tax=Acinetobacter rathckeae TaxID=2605272 RepID=UPI0018A2519B|nr:cation efflux protein, CzcI-like [Acinetobacter rathckeae]MBF7687215.1 cation transporter [Acinetobacter rathckeae]MBF7694432.1 cation transporter [Acinetobacter rathckeae]